MPFIKSPFKTRSKGPVDEKTYCLRCDPDKFQFCECKSNLDEKETPTQLRMAEGGPSSPEEYIDFDKEVIVNSEHLRNEEERLVREVERLKQEREQILRQREEFKQEIGVLRENLDETLRLKHQEEHHLVELMEKERQLKIKLVSLKLSQKKRFWKFYEL